MRKEPKAAGQPGLINRLDAMKIIMKLKQEIMEKTKQYYQTVHNVKKEFIPGITHIPYAGRVYDEIEMVNLVDAALEFWLTTGRYTDRFEKEFAEFLDVRHCSLVNSGSSANLLAFMALTSDILRERRIERGDEVITVAAAFPTTVAPIIQYGAMPVFVDVELDTCNIDAHKLKEAFSNKTKAVMLAHTLGNPFDIAVVKDFCEKNKLWLIEDNCDALGSRYKGRYTGTTGDICTSSFYPPHHITMGEGGAVYTNNDELHQIVRSMRDWGRDCRCPPGKDNVCGKRFGLQMGELPFGYDHKYIYSHFGYNLKATDLQAAIGCAQLEKLPLFIKARQDNWKFIRDSIADLEKYFIMPEASPGSEPSWFGFLLTLRENTPFTRDNLVQHLECMGLQTRMLFAGNIIKHPCFDEMRGKGCGFRIAGDLRNTDIIMERSFWIGVYPGLTTPELNFMIQALKEFVSEYEKRGSV
jgi:CDP-6-deoxy-D-xylo-4-hexulose-3-dehydrase